MIKLSPLQHRTLKLGSVVILVGGLIGDIITTYIGISRFGASEANPIARGMMNYWGNPEGFILLSAMVLAFVLSVSRWIEHRHDGWLGQWGSIAPMAIVGAMQVVVVAWNTRLILLAA